MRLYDSLADWWPLMSPPEDYAEEAVFYGSELMAAGDRPARTVVEFGSGGGNNASFLKRQFQMTLVEPAEGMLAVSRQLNPECEHVAGDMRTARLGRQFDRVFIHDAICYLTTLDDLRRAAETAFVHCRPGGAALFAPDCVRETFLPSTDCGGEDGQLRALRYLEWCYDPDPADTTYTVDYVFALRFADGSVQVEHDRHIEGLFTRAEWLAVLRDAGFIARSVPFVHSEEPRTLEVFVGVKPL
jgi:SAM-dependent methyltransferase